MNRIDKLFEQKKSGILSVFFTAGFPQLDSAPDIAKALVAAGVDMIEIGIPFSDPIADGPTIQQSNKVAIENGMTVKLLMKQLKEIRRKIDIPIILMGYLNPVMQYGVEKFCRDAVGNGADGLIIPDMPLSEYENRYRSLFKELNFYKTFLISPTTPEERIRKIDELSQGFIYGVSSSSTTGARTEFSTEQVSYFSKLKEMNLRNPFLIGFGISNSQTFSTATSYGAGAIVGSAFINILRDSKDISGDVTKFIKQLRSNS